MKTAVTRQRLFPRRAILLGSISFLVIIATFAILHLTGEHIRRVPTAVSVVFAAAGAFLIGFGMDRIDTDTRTEVKAMIKTFDSDNPLDHLAYQRATQRRRIGFWVPLVSAMVCYALALLAPYSMS